MVSAAIIMGLTGLEARSQLALDGRPSPRCRPGTPILIAYVDNAAAHCWDSRDSRSFLYAFIVLESLGLRFRIEADNEAAWDNLGITSFATAKLLTNKADRVWQLRGAAVELRLQGKCTRLAMLKFLGNIVHAFQLRRCLYSVLVHVFVFIGEAAESILGFNHYVDQELRAIAALLPIIVLNVGADVFTQALVSDASLKGNAVLRCHFPAGVLEDTTDCREIWRFKPERPGPASVVGRQLESAYDFRRQFHDWAAQKRV